MTEPTRQRTPVLAAAAIIAATALTLTGCMIAPPDLNPAPQTPGATSAPSPHPGKGDQNKADPTAAPVPPSSVPEPPTSTEAPASYYDNAYPCLILFNELYPFSNDFNLVDSHPNAYPPAGPLAGTTPDCSLVVEEFEGAGRGDIANLDTLTFTLIAQPDPSLDLNTQVDDWAATNGYTLVTDPSDLNAPTPGSNDSGYGETALHGIWQKEQTPENEPPTQDGTWTYGTSLILVTPGAITDRAALDQLFAQSGITVDPNSRILIEAVGWQQLL